MFQQSCHRYCYHFGPESDQTLPKTIPTETRSQWGLKPVWIIAESWCQCSKMYDSNPPSTRRFVQDLQAVRIHPHMPEVSIPHRSLSCSPPYSTHFSVVDHKKKFFSVPVHKELSSNCTSTQMDVVPCGIFPTVYYMCESTVPQNVQTWVFWHCPTIAEILFPKQVACQMWSSQ